MKEYLIAYEYGTGAVWGVVEARTAAEIAVKMPEVVIHHEAPAWMTADDLDVLRRVCSFEVGEVGYLDRLLEARNRNVVAA